MFVFGGGFVGGARDHDTEYFLFLANNGYDVVSIDYRLGMRGIESPGIIEFLKAMDKTINIAVEDLYSATNFILDHADEWQIDPTKIVVSGSSAGAITSLQAEYAICNSLPVAKSLKEGFNYAGVIAFAGAVFTLDGAPKWEKQSAPTLLFHGSSDTQVPFTKMAAFGIGMYGSKYIADKLHDSGMPYWLYSVEYETHSMSSKPMHENHKEILLFLDEYVMQQRPLQRTTHTIDKNIPKRKTFFLPTDFINANY
jgi:carboxylesterase type B